MDKKSKLKNHNNETKHLDYDCFTWLLNPLIMFLGI